MIFDLNNVPNQDVTVQITANARINDKRLNFNGEKIQSISVIDNQGLPLFMIENDDLNNGKIDGQLKVYNEVKENNE